MVIRARRRIRAEQEREMKYDYKIIGNRIKARTGKRIKELRKKAGYKTIEKFADELGYSRQTVAKWESGNAMPTLDQLCDIVSLLECDIGYLLCLYDTRYFEHADVCKATGLSEEAVNVLIENKNMVHSDFVSRYIVEGIGISEAIQRLKESHENSTERRKYLEFDVTDSFLDLVKEYIK